MPGRHLIQFRLPKLNRRQLSRALAYCTATRQIAPTFIDWLRDQLADELAARLECYTSAGRALRGAPIEQPFMQLPTWSCADLADALRWCHAAVHNMRDYKLGKLADLLHGQVVVAVAARLNRMENPAHAHAA